MPVRNKFFPGTSVSRYLPPGDASWDEVVFESGKIITDSELILAPEVSREIRGLILDRTIPSGWVRGTTPTNPLDDFSAGTTADTFRMIRRTANVAGLPVVVEYTNTTTANLNVIQLDAAPVFGGAPPDVKRTDFVFLEVWRCLVAPSPRATAIIEVVTNASITAGDVITINGVPLTFVAGAPGVDQVQIGGSENATATNIAAAINNVLNSYDGITSAAVDVTLASQVNLRASDSFAGVAGNALTLSITLGVGGCITVNGGAGPTTFSGGADTGNKPTQTTLYRHGNVDAPSGVNLADTIADPTIGAESTQRVQIQYRIRVTGAAEAVNFKTENGFSNVNVLAQGTQGAPVATYRFVPADGSTVAGGSSAAAYITVDPGLWIAGAGDSTSATALGTVDGYVYAIPLAFVFRRNDAYNAGAGAGFSTLNNTNGALPATHILFANPEIGSIPIDTSDRPDGRFHDRIVVEDILDLRKQVVPGGIDLKAELERQMSALLDGSMFTWAIDGADKNTLGAGSGDVSSQFLVCNEIGRSAARGGVAPSSGSTTRGDNIADFDHVRRRFADWPVVERLVLPILPTDDSATQPGKYVTKASLGFTTWQEGDVISIDLTNLDCTGLGDWLDAPSGVPTGGGFLSNLFPSGTLITNILSIRHDDGNYNAAIVRDVELDQVVGLGSTLIDITLASNDLQATGGINVAGYPLVGTSAGPDANSPRAIWVELEVTYPIGSGTTDTPDLEVTPAATVYPNGPVFENDTSQRPDDWEGLLPPVFREGYREIAVEYVANDGSGAGSGTPITTLVVSEDPLEIHLPRRIHGSATATTSVTDQVSALNRPVDTTSTEYGSSTRKMFVQGGSPLSGAGQTLVSVEYFAQDPLPNWGGVGYQISVYYRSNAPQTVGVQAGAPAAYPLPSPLTVKPIVMSRDLWTGSVSSGSVDLAYPYSNPLDQIAVNEDVNPAEFPAEWILSATAQISVGDFSAETGLLNLHQMVPADGNSSFTLSDKGVDSEFRAHYKISDPASYRPVAMAQPLSGPGRHKTWFPFLAISTTDNVLFRKGEVLLVVVSRFGFLDDLNVVQFTDSGTDTCAAIYRTRGLLLMSAE